MILRVLSALPVITSTEFIKISNKILTEAWHAWLYWVYRPFMQLFIEHQLVGPHIVNADHSIVDACRDDEMVVHTVWIQVHLWYRPLRMSESLSSKFRKYVMRSDRLDLLRLVYVPQRHYSVLISAHQQGVVPVEVQNRVLVRAWKLLGVAQSIQVPITPTIQQFSRN